MTQFVALAPRTTRAQRPPIRILVCEEDRPVAELDAAVDAIAREAQLPIGQVRRTPFSSEDAPFGALPVPESWDIALLIPGPILDKAHQKGQLAPLEVKTRDGAQRRPWLVVDVSAYGLVELGPTLRPRAWGELSEGVTIPDIEREPAFLDIVAGLRERREIADFARIWWSVRASRTSAEIRAWDNAREERAKREREPGARPLAILRLRDDEIPSFEDLPTARLGLALSSRAPEAMRELALGLAEPRALERWLGGAPRLREHASRLRYPPSRERVRAARDFVYRRYQGQPSDLPDWANTALLTLFVAAFVYLVFRSRRARASARKGD